MAYSTLEVVNSMLGLLGELPVNSINDPHTLIPAALAAINNQNSLVQVDFWWFNVEYPTLIPQTPSGLILLPADAASVDSLTQYPRLAVRGNRLYNLDDITDVFTQPLRVRLHRVLSFEDAPAIARAHIGAKAKLEFQMAYDGDGTKAQFLQQEIKETYIRLHSEHIRNAKANMLMRPSVQHTLNRITGARPYVY
jgi:hypothetical protein